MHTLKHYGVGLCTFIASAHNRARKSRRTLQNKVRIKVFPEQLTLFINTLVALKQCVIQQSSTISFLLLLGNTCSFIF